MEYKRSFLNQSPTVRDYVKPPIPTNQSRVQDRWIPDSVTVVPSVTRTSIYLKGTQQGNPVKGNGED